MSRKSADPDADPEGPDPETEEYGILSVGDDEIVLYSLSNHSSWIQSDVSFTPPR